MFTQTSNIYCRSSFSGVLRKDLSGKFHKILKRKRMIEFFLTKVKGLSRI